MVARIWLGLCEAGMAEIRKWADIEKDLLAGQFCWVTVQVWPCGVSLGIKIYGARRRI